MKEKEIIGDSALKRLGEVMGFGEKTKPDCVGGKQYCGDCKVNENIIPREALLEEPDEKSCGKSSCGACGEDCEVISAGGRR